MSKVVRDVVIRYQQAMTWALRHEKAVLLGLFALALALRVLYMALAVGLDSPPTYDGIGYHILASNLMRGNGYVREDGQPTACRPPTYSFFLAGVYSVFGFNYSAGRIAHAIVGSITCLVIYVLAKKLFSKLVAIVALAGAVVYPLFIYMTGEFFPDTVALLPAVLSLWVAVSMMESKSSGWPLLLGVLLAITITLRTTYSFLLPFLVLWFFVVFKLKQAVANAILVSIVFSIMLAPWVVRNYIIFGEFIPLGSNSGVSLWAGNNPMAEGRGTPVVPGSWEGPNPPDLNWNGWSGISETESSRRFLQAGFDWIRRHPVDFLCLVPRKLAYAWSPVSYGVAYSRQTSSTLAIIVLPPYLMFLALAFVGMLGNRCRWKTLGPLYCSILAVSVTAIIFYGATRHALLMHPSLLLFSAAGVKVLLEKLSLYARIQ